MSEINIKLLSDDALNYLSKNIESITKKVQNETNNDWIYTTFPQPMFIDKKYKIPDFDLKDNPNSKDKELDLNNSITLYNSLKGLPRYVLVDQRFWLWLHFEKFYSFVLGTMPVKSSSTIKDHWMQKQGKRRGLFFGVLSRMYFRVELTEMNGQYELTKWVIDNPNRFRNLTWRTYSSEKHIVLGVLKGEKKAFEEKGIENSELYEYIGKYVSLVGSVRLLDAIESEEYEQIVYDETLKYISDKTVN